MAQAEPRRTGIEKMMAEEEAAAAPKMTSATRGILTEPLPGAASTEAADEPEVSERADSGRKAKTTMPRIAGGYKLPSSSLLQRPDEHRLR